MGRHCEPPTMLIAERTRSQQLRVAPKNSTLIFEKLMISKVAHHRAKWRLRVTAKLEPEHQERTLKAETPAELADWLREKCEEREPNLKSSGKAAEPYNAYRSGGGTAQRF